MNGRHIPATDAGGSVKLNISGFPEPFRLVEFNPNEASEKLWGAYFSLTETVFREFNQKGRLPNRKTTRQLLAAPNPLYSVKKWLLLDSEQGGAALASLSYDTKISPDYENCRHIGQCHIEVAPPLRHKKIAVHLLHHMIRAARIKRKDTIRADADNATGVEFCRYLNGNLLHKEYQYRLYLEDVDWQMVEEWCAKGRSRFPETHLTTFQECSAERIDEFCRVYTKIINQRPVGDIQEDLIMTPESRRIEERNMKKRNIEWHTMISREEGDRISALTDIFYSPLEPHRVHQYFTGVLKDYRRRGLAKRLKAEMLFHIRDRFPETEYITTYTAKENSPMRAINKQLGFESRKALYMFQWPMQELERRVIKILQASDKIKDSKRKQ